MIFQKIFILEQELQKHLREGRKKEKAINNIKTLLKRVDNNAEVVPAKDYNKLILLMSFLKEKPLSRQEKMVLKEIVEA